MRTLTHSILAAALSSTLLGCGTEEESSRRVQEMDARGQLIRLSVDMRGTHPSEDELRYVEDAANLQAAYEAYADRWIEEPAFVDRMVEIFDQRYKFQTGDVYFDPMEVGLQIDDQIMAEMIANEPLQLLRYVINNDLSYKEMVTADHSMANPEIALYWGMEYPEDAGGGWAPSKYVDGRPHAGLLTMTTMWQRYPSMGGNANRHRANAISKLFLCDDYLSRPIVLNRAAVDQLTIDPENAISQNVGCQSCHSTLDPLAANFYGFFNYDAEDGIDQTIYRPENEEEWRSYAGKEPGYYGTPTANISEFGERLANDSRYTECAVQTVWEGLTQRTLVDEDWEELSPHRVAFEESGLNLKVLVRSIITSEEYKAAKAMEPTLGERLPSVKTASPAQLAGIISGITGYRWFFDGRDALIDNALGLGVLAGGTDGRFITERSYVPSVGSTFVLERYAQAAAWNVAEYDLDPNRTGSAKLLYFVTVADTPDNNPEAFEEQIRFLFLSATGRPLAEDAVEPEQLVALWRYVYSVEASPVLAWSAVLTAILRDPAVLFY
jgi:hypothetical protein